MERRARLEPAVGEKEKAGVAARRPGDVKEPFADIAAIGRDLGFKPTTSIEEGLPRFVAWFRDYHGV